MFKERIQYRKDLKELARQLRNNSTLGEVLLWGQLKGKQRHGFDFHRQKPISNYIVDFYCPKLRLAIEVDGISHLTKADADILRDNKLKRLGIATLRFRESDVRKNLGGVVLVIDQWIQSHENHTPRTGRTDGLSAPL